MDLALSEEQLAAVGRLLAEATGAKSARMSGLAPLAGGAIQENWALEAELHGGRLDGRHALVLRTDAPAPISFSLTRAQEFQLLGAAWAAGVRVPQPILLCEDTAVIGRPFYLMRRAGGIAAGHRLVRGDLAEARRDALVEQLGRELARIHTIRPPQPALDFLPDPLVPVALDRVATYRRRLDALAVASPALEWGLRWLERNAPAAGDIILCHEDFRTGNYLVQDGELTAILDWEFARWGDPHEDLGWFCARCWRFGAVEREAGGIGSRAAFYRGYEQISGRTVDDAQVRYWEVMAAVRWAVIAAEQAGRRTVDRRRALELALTAHIVPELEQDILMQTAA